MNARDAPQAAKKGRDMTMTIRTRLFCTAAVLIGALVRRRQAPESSMPRRRAAGAHLAGVGFRPTGVVLTGTYLHPPPGVA